MKAAAFETLMDNVNLNDVQKVAMRKAVHEGVETNVVFLRDDIRFPRSDFHMTDLQKFDDTHFYITSNTEVMIRPVMNSITKVDDRLLHLDILRLNDNSFERAIS